MASKKNRWEWLRWVVVAIVGVFAVVFLCKGASFVAGRLSYPWQKPAPPTQIPVQFVLSNSVVEVTSTVAAPAIGIAPQPQVQHPSLYMETGITGTQTWSVSVPVSSTLIVGGVCVDSVCDGVYRAVQGPQILSVKVVNGFVLIIKDQWAAEEWCFRVRQAAQYGWAKNNLSPLSGWTCR